MVFSVQASCCHGLLLVLESAWSRSLLKPFGMQSMQPKSSYVAAIRVASSLSEECIMQSSSFFFFSSVNWHGADPFGVQDAAAKASFFFGRLSAFGRKSSSSMARSTAGTHVG